MVLTQLAPTTPAPLSKAVLFFSFAIFPRLPSVVERPRLGRLFRRKQKTASFLSKVPTSVKTHRHPFLSICFLSSLAFLLLLSCLLSRRSKGRRGSEEEAPRRERRREEWAPQEPPVPSPSSEETWQRNPPLYSPKVITAPSSILALTASL